MYTESLVNGQPIDRQELIYRLMASALIAGVFGAGEAGAQRFASSAQDYANTAGPAIQKQVDAWAKNYAKKLKKNDYFGTLNANAAWTAARQERVGPIMASIAAYILSGTKLSVAVQVAEGISDAIAEELIK